MSKQRKPEARTRREFMSSSVKGASLLSMASYAPSFLQQTVNAQNLAPSSDQKILVIVQMAGGNDGLNTVIPFEDDAYYSRRPNLAQKKYHQLGDYTGLNLACPEMHKMYENDEMAVIQNVGYPNPNRSHFRATDIYEMGSLKGRTGWVGRYLDAACPNTASQKQPVAVNMGKSIPMTFWSMRTHNVYSKISADDTLMETAAVDKNMLGDKETLGLLKDSIKLSSKMDHSTAAYLSSSFMDALVSKEKMDAIFDSYRPGKAYKGGGFGKSLEHVAALIAKGLPTRVYYTKIGGFDTHADQAQRHGKLLAHMSGAIGSFYDDLKSKGLDKQVTTMAFSEFGRRIDENGSNGTDHGTVAPMFVFGPNVNGGVYGGGNIKLADCGGDLPFNQEVGTDFRQVYTTVLENWMGANSSKMFDKKYEAMSFI